MARFKVVTPIGASFTVAGGGYGYEIEALSRIDAEIVEAPGATAQEFIAAAHDADAVYAKGIPITKTMIDGLERCKVIALGTVGVDSVDVAAATERGIPVTNVPDTFIEEVADHAMMLLLATFRGLVVQDRMVRDGRWREGRPALLKIPRLMGRPWASSPSAMSRARSRCAPGRSACGMLAYDPYRRGAGHDALWRRAGDARGAAEQSDFVSMHAPATRRRAPHADREAFPA